MSKPIPDAALSQHLAVLGKTGGGKTITAKLAVEQVVADGARVCVLDPIKSDWWGLTSSADGKKPGLPFRILGGPRGHVPLHDAAGKAIAEVVAAGSLPLSVIDMADFPPGGQSRFFVDFAPVLLRRMRGVLYLVMEEAHLFAPKERSGIGAENMAIHWAKMLATAGRSKGVRLILLTQRTQALHNALLGSCDSVIAHRLTAPADQKPVMDWLKANTDAETTARVAESLSSLKTGEGWLCSGEAKLFERRTFPMIKTYDNTRTPTSGDGEHHVKTAPVDAEQLKALIGDAVKEAEATDPAAMKRRIAHLEKQLAIMHAATPAPVEKIVEVPVLKNGQLERTEKIIDRLAGIGDKVATEAAELRRLIAPAAAPRQPVPIKPAAPIRPAPALPRPAAAPRPAAVADPDAKLSKAERLILTALAQYPAGRTLVQVAVLTRYAHSGGGFRNALGSLRTKGAVEGAGDSLRITDAGLALLGDFTPLPTGDALLDHWRRQLGKAEREILDVLAGRHPDRLTLEQVAAETPSRYAPDGGGFRNAVGRLRSLELIEGRGEVKASDDLFG